MNSILIRVKAEAGARKEKFESADREAFSIAVKEKPQENAANERIRVLIAKHFHVPAKNVRIVSGQHKKSKLFSVIQS